jgi:ABC-2 type transport system permease protein
MVGNIRTALELTVPVVNRINPATLIADSMQALCIMGNMEKFTSCIFGIVIWCVCLIGGSMMIIMLRQKRAGRSVAKA